MLQHGAYGLLLEYCYSRDTFRVPEGLSTSYRICRASTPAERAAVREVLGEYFPGGINRRIQRQLPEELSRIQVARDNGALGGRPRTKPSGFDTGNPAGFSGVNPEGTQVESSPTPTPTPSPSPTPTPSPDRKARRFSITGGAGGSAANQPKPRSRRALPAAPPEGTPGLKKNEMPVIQGLNQAAFAEWDCERRRRGGKSKASWSHTAKRKAANFLAQHAPAEQQGIVDASIQAGWQGLFAMKNGNGRAKTFKEIDAENEEARMKPIREGFIARHGPQAIIEGEVENE